eukprot:CAMPEP_0118986204 /NCGR_PEP_ID=MMETSP1173-20130426/41657_1 /TAXON_ID=1034831 /ORGANISM="Rhizochromulina marina cf, Strain CCMP1243" /LENGTH=42 /DNA_ID= /DNA_START= /DNA_END= /DNA_ORIENTATION=
MTPQVWYEAALRGFASMERWKSFRAASTSPRRDSSTPQHCQA